MPGRSAPCSGTYALTSSRALSSLCLLPACAPLYCGSQQPSLPKARRKQTAWQADMQTLLSLSHISLSLPCVWFRQAGHRQQTKTYLSLCLLGRLISLVSLCLCFSSHAASSKKQAFAACHAGVAVEKSSQAGVAAWQ